jgi:hypothetical protein
VHPDIGEVAAPAITAGTRGGGSAFLNQLSNGLMAINANVANGTQHQFSKLSCTQSLQLINTVSAGQQLETSSVPRNPEPSAVTPALLRHPCDRPFPIVGACCATAGGGVRCKG